MRIVDLYKAEVSQAIPLRRVFTLKSINLMGHSLWGEYHDEDKIAFKGLGELNSTATTTAQYSDFKIHPQTSFHYFYLGVADELSDYIKTLKISRILRYKIRQQLYSCASETMSDHIVEDAAQLFIHRNKLTPDVFMALIEKFTAKYGV